MVSPTMVNGTLSGGDGWRAGAILARTAAMDETANIEIGRANPRLPAVRALIAELDQLMTELYPAESNHLVDVDALAGPDVVFIAAATAVETLGCGGIMIREGGYAEVKRIYVSPRARGRGLGRRLLARLESEARACGMTLLRLETGRQQTEALALFAASGFSPCGPFGDYPPDDPHSVFLEKRL
jgi:putative acetyltransferase